MGELEIIIAIFIGLYKLVRAIFRLFARLIRAILQLPEPNRPAEPKPHGRTFLQRRPVTAKPTPPAPTPRPVMPATRPIPTGPVADPVVWNDPSALRDAIILNEILTPARAQRFKK